MGLTRTVKLGVIIFAFLAALVVALTANIEVFDDHLQSMSIVFEQNFNLFLTLLSVGYFQRTTLYEAMLRSEEVFLEEYLANLKNDFPLIKEIDIVPQEASFEGLFSVQVVEDYFLTRFKIFDDLVENFVPDRVVFAKIPIKNLVQHFGLYDLEVKRHGFEFPYGFKVALKRKPLGIAEFLIAGIIALLSYLFVLSIDQLRQKRIVQKDLFRILKYSLALEAMIELMQRLLMFESVELTYQDILTAAVRIVPGAHAGSLTIKEGDFLVFKAAVGYDLKQLQRVRFDLKKVPVPLDANVSIIAELADIDARILSEEELKVLKEHGRLDEIKAVLRVPIVVNRELKGHMNLDNFERQDAFDDDSVRLAQLFSNIVGVLLDRLILEARLFEERQKFEYLSYHDSLTDLPNRRYFYETGGKLLALAEREKKNVCVFFIDLAKFKQLNDTYGHSLGDEVLKSAANRFREAVRKTDVVARFGGDEFLILAYDMNQDAAVEFVERLVDHLRQPMLIGSNTFSIYANVGLAIYPTDAETLEDLIKKADVALYAAKRNNLTLMMAQEIDKNG